MKHILVPTDFSENAEHALDYAINIANQFGATVHLVHAYHTTGHAGHLANLDRVVKEDRDKEMDKLISSKKSLISERTTLEGNCLKGYVKEGVTHSASKVSADLIVMGTLGKNQPNVFMGSTAKSLMAATNKPILAVPLGVDQSPSKVVASLDAYTMSNPSILYPLIQLVKQFNAKLHLVHVSDEAMNTEIDPTIQAYLREAKLAYTYTRIQDGDIVQSVLNFVQKKEADMLCVVARERSWFSGLFHKSVSQKMAMNAEIPILVLHD